MLSVVYHDVFVFLQIRHEDGKIYPMRFAVVINCAGPWSGEVGRMAGIGTGDGVMRFPIPVEPRYMSIR